MKVIENTDGGCVTEPVDPRVRRTRQLLRDALHSLLAEKRFHAISVQDIAERATVNRATFYAHYTDKDDLAASSLRVDLHSALKQRFPERPTMNHDNLVEIAVGVFEFMANVHSQCPKAAAEFQDSVGTTIQQSIYEMMVGFLSKGSAHNRLFQGRDKETVAAVLSWSIYGGALQWSRSDRSVPASKVCRDIVSMLVPREVEG